MEPNLGRIFLGGEGLNLYILFTFIQEYLDFINLYRYGLILPYVITYLSCYFLWQYLGCMEVYESRGMQVCEEAVKTLKSVSTNHSLFKLGYYGLMAFST